MNDLPHREISRRMMLARSVSGTAGLAASPAWADMAPPPPFYSDVVQFIQLRPKLAAPAQLIRTAGAGRRGASMRKGVRSRHWRARRGALRL
jgi:hypothetical protein